MKKSILTDEEWRAVATLERLASRWPGTLRLVLCQGTRELRVSLRGDVEDADDLAAVDGIRIPALIVDSHS